MLERVDFEVIRKKLKIVIIITLLSGILVAVSVFWPIVILSYLAIIGSFVTFFILVQTLRNEKKREEHAKNSLSILQNEVTRTHSLLHDIIPAITLLAKEDAAIAAIAHRSSIAFPSENAEPFERLRLFIDSFEPPSDSSIEKTHALSTISQTVESLQEMELRIPFIEEILKRVVLHTEKAALTLIERFSIISEQTDKSDKDAKNAIAALGAGNGNENGLESLIKKSHETIIGRTSVITAFLRLNRENADRVRKISDLVTKSEELISGIEDITERSKLIAFNMAVESAKIGDKGLGFRVIVHELQRLNDQTTHFARDIMEIVKSFRAYNQEMLDQWLVKSESLTEQVKTDSEQAEIAVTALKHSYELNGTLFRSLSDSAISVNRSMSDILESLQFQDITRQQIDGAISFLLDINNAVATVRKQFENLGYALGDTHAVLHGIRTKHEAQLKVSKDHDIFELIERRYK